MEKMQIGNIAFNMTGKTYIMGILNITPDSFSDGGKWNTIDAALSHGEQMIKDGADIIDIGGESTRPGYTQMSSDEELERVIPVIHAMKKRLDIPLSIDTYKADVAKESILAGADLVNDIWGLQYDENMATVIAKADVACCIMHNRKEARYNNLIEDVHNDLRECISTAKAAGIRDDKIVIDPGIGFAKSCEDNLQLMNGLEQFHKLGYPILLGTSRKSMIGITLGLPVDQRLEGTLATTVIGVMKGVMFVRVHDILENSRVIKMAEAIVG